MDESARARTETFDHDSHHSRRDELPAVAPAIAALTIAAAGLTLVAGYWLLRSSRRDAEKRAAFPAPAIHRRT